MSEDGLLKKMKADSKVRKILAWPLDFDLAVTKKDAESVVVKPNAVTKPVARDGTGGIFLLYGTHEYVVHITSEGQAGVIAADLATGVQLMTEYPYWRDLLNFSGGGKLQEMRRVAPYLERDLRKDEPKIDEYRETLRKRLGFDGGGDLIGYLHEAVAVLGKKVTVTDPDGTKFESLFGRFTVKSNPMWKRG